MITIRVQKGMTNQSAQIFIESDALPASSVVESMRMIEGDAQNLFHALLKSLPGGTYDRLFELMQQSYKQEEMGSAK